MSANIGLVCADQEFPIAVTTRNRRFNNTQDTPLRRVIEPLNDIRACAFMERAIAHDATLRDPRTADLELRLYQRDQIRAGSREAEGRGKSDTQTYEAHVTDDDLGRLRQQRSRQVTGIDALH